MLEALTVVLTEICLAFAGLDLVFRQIPVSPALLPQSLRRYGWGYAAAAILFAGAGTAIQWHLAGPAGACLAPLNVIPWWLFWRFGLRKQLPFLFARSGRPHLYQNPGR